MKKLITVFVAFTTLFSNAQNPVLEEHWWQPNGEVNAIAKDTVNNIVYLGGQFTGIGPYEPKGSIANLTTGNVNYNCANPNGSIYCSISDGAGGWFIGGQFSQVGDSLRSCIAHIDGNGQPTAWNSSSNNIVWALVKNGNSLYVGGDFTSIGGQSRSKIAEVDATTGVATSWDPNSGNRVRALALSGSTIFAGGTFTSIGGQSRNRIAALDAVTGMTTVWNPNSDNTVIAITVDGSNIYVGGDFTNIGGSARNKIACISSTTGLATTWNPNVSAPITSNVWAIAVNSTNVYVGGQFSTINGLARSGLAALNKTTGAASTWNPLTTGAIYSISLTATTVYVGGQFASIGGQTRGYTAELNMSNGLATSWNPNADGSVYSISSSGVNMYIGGSFNFIGLVSRNYVAALDATSGQLTPWDPNANSVVQSLAVSGSMVYAGGWFTTIGGQTRNRIAALDATSGAATAWNPNASNTVNSVVVSNSIVYAGGDFVTIGGQTRNRIAALNTTTGLATTWNPNSNNGVNVIIVSGNLVYAGGDFTTIGGQTRNRIVRLDATTGLATTWNPNSNLTVRAIALAGTTIYAGGDFTSIGGQIRNRIAAIDSTTGLATSWNPNANSTIFSIAVVGSRVYIGGNFSSLNGQPGYAQFFGLNASTAAFEWSAWPNSNVNAILATGTSLYLGGNFTTCNAIQRNKFAAYAPPCVTTFGTDVQTACNSYLWIDGNTYSSSTNLPTFTLTNAAGCDSIVTLNLNINNSNTGIDVQTACNSYLWIDGNTYSSNTNLPTFTLTNAAGCDSIVTLNLTINNSNSGTDVQSACNSYSWIDGNTYNSSNNTAIWTLTNAAGCDSLITLDLTINYSNAGTDVQEACNSYAWIDGITYTMSNNTATWTLTNAAGCDSVVTLNLTINNSTTETDVQTACNSYTWIDGVTYTMSNNAATWTLTNAAGCDSLVTLDLTINYSNAGTDVQAACNSYTWIDGVIYTASNNTAIWTLTNSAGCDSTITLDLTINNVDNSVTIIDEISLEANAASAQYQWLDCNDAFNPIMNETNQLFVASMNGDYAVEVTENGCTDTSTCYLIDNVGIKDFSASDIRIYPNPTLDFVTVQLGSNDIHTIQLIDTWGRTLKTLNVSAEEVIIDLQKLEIGVYYLKLITDNSIRIEQVVRQ